MRLESMIIPLVYYWLLFSLIDLKFILNVSVSQSSKWSDNESIQHASSKWWIPPPNTTKIPIRNSSLSHVKLDCERSNSISRHHKTASVIIVLPCSCQLGNIPFTRDNQIPQKQRDTNERFCFSASRIFIVR